MGTKRYPDYNITDDSRSEIIVKPKRGFGGWVTIFFGQEVTPMTRFVRLNLDGYWVQCSYELFKEFRLYYGLSYLQHKKYDRKHMRCAEVSNTCLPDFSKLHNGRGGM